MKENKNINDDIFDILSYADTPLFHEHGLADGLEFWATSEVAGLQYYSYNKEDELVGRVVPNVGDTINIMRRPDNTADSNACEIWWRNSFLLGHLPRDVAYYLAKGLDNGKSIKCYVINSGNGSKWSMQVIVIGSAVEKLHTKRIVECRKEREEKYVEYINEQVNDLWPRGTDGREPYDSQYQSLWRPIVRQYRQPPTQEQFNADDEFHTALTRIRVERLKDAVIALLPLANDSLVLSTEYGEQGKMYCWWKDVPNGLKTKTAWQKLGYKIDKKTEAHAKIGHKRGYGYKEYLLYRTRDVVAIKKPDSSIGYDVERSVEYLYNQYDFEA